MDAPSRQDREEGYLRIVLCLRRSCQFIYGRSWCIRRTTGKAIIRSKSHRNVRTFNLDHLIAGPLTDPCAFRHGTVTVTPAEGSFDEILGDDTRDSSS